MDTPYSPPRIHRHFEDELEKLRALLIRMGSLVDEQIELASRAVLDGELDSARFVLKREVRVNEYDLMVDALCQRILALSQPVAVDLRLLIGAMRIDSEFERIGDIAVNLAERTEALSGSRDILKRAKTDVSFAYSERNIAVTVPSGTAIIDIKSVIITVPMMAGKMPPSIIPSLGSWVRNSHVNRSAPPATMEYTTTTTIPTMANAESIVIACAIESPTRLRFRVIVVITYPEYV